MFATVRLLLLLFISMANLASMIAARRRYSASPSHPARAAE
jgi:hypothetical protein